MAKGSKIAYRRGTRKKVWVEKQSSDEDYMVSEEEGFDESEDENCSFVSEDESEESLGEFEEEEEDDDDDGEHEEDLGKNRMKKVSGPRGRKGFQGRKNNGVAKPRKKRAAYSEEEKRRNKTRVLSADKYADYNEKSRKKCKVSYREEKGDDDSDYNINEEFAPDDEKEFIVTKRKRVSQPKKRLAAQIPKGKKRKRNSKVVKRARRKKPPRTQQVVRRRNRSDQDYTISEVERELVREATDFCRMLTPSKRSNKVLKVVSNEEVAPSQSKLPGKKGKEKLGDMMIEVGKQVCGICLSEEGTGTVRGILNCCSHYFCFACIMEWSKVESRCPLCKQRFATISRTARIEGKFNLQRRAIPVPERDQVYQPSEEELRNYLDPYENFLCTECHQGGDDPLMLLCDLCDSPAHTYCVGLGHEVPEGNWYCDGCKPTVLGSSNVQAMNLTPVHGADYNLAVVSPPGAVVQETFDLNELYVHDTPLTQVTGYASSHRHSIGDNQVASFSSGSMAFTLHERRRIQRQINQFLNNRSRHTDRSDFVAQVSGGSLFGSQIGQDGVMAPQQTVAPARIEQQNNYHQRRLPNYSDSVHNSEALSPRLSSLRGQMLDNEASASTDRSLNGLPMLGRGFTNQQFHPCSSRPSRGPDTSLLPSQFREMSHSPREKELVQSMVKRHLKSLSRNLEIGTFKDVARTSTHTILAAVGLEHWRNKVYPVRTRPLSCDHFESRHTCPIKGQCSSCFDWFVRNVVREIMYARVSIVSTG